MRRPRKRAGWIAGFAESSGRPIVKKLGMLGIIGGAALLTAAPFSLQWSKDEAALALTVVDAKADGVARVHRRVYRRTYRRAACVAAPAGLAGYGYGPFYPYTGSYYSAYYAPKPYWNCYRPVSTSVRAVYWPYPPHRYSYYLAPFATVSSTDASLRGR
jgi:hypothetical protein